MVFERSEGYIVGVVRTFVRPGPYHSTYWSGCIAIVLVQAFVNILC